MRTVLFLAAIGLTACHDLPELGICGNGIVEQNLGEACDDGGASTRCTATCDLACLTSAEAPPGYQPVSAAADALRCPATASDAPPYACATDRTCRQPSMTFAAPTAAVELFVDTAPIAGDVNGDGIVDLVGTNTTDVVARLGGADDDLLRQAPLQSIPGATARPRVFVSDRAAAGQSKVALAVTTEGIALLRSDDTQFVPEFAMAYEVVLPASIITFSVRDPDPTATYGDVVMAAQTASAEVGPTVGVLGAARVEVPASSGDGFAVAAGVAGGCPVDPVAPRRNARLVQLKVDDDLGAFTIMARPEAGAGWSVCRFTPTGAAAPLWQMAWKGFAGDAPASFAWADLAEDGCPDLVFSRGGHLEVAAATPSSGACALSSTPTAVDASSQLGGAVLAAGQLVPGGPDELVLTDGVGAVVGGRLVRLAQPEGDHWSNGALVDVTGDGVLDAIVARASTVRPLSGLDIVRGGGLPNQYRVETHGPILRVIPGDYDGDRVGDAALIETNGTQERLSMLFGSREHALTTPTYATEFVTALQAQRIRTATWPATAPTHDGIDDIAVAHAHPTDPTKVAAGILVGDARRVPTTPRYPRIDTGTNVLRPLQDVAFGPALPTLGPAQILTARGTSDPLQLFVTDADREDATHNSWTTFTLFAPGAASDHTIRPPYGFVGAQTPLFAATWATPTVVAPGVVRFANQARPCIAASVVGDRFRYGSIDTNGDGDGELVVFVDGDVPRIEVFDVDDCPLAGGTLGGPVLTLDGCHDLAALGGRVFAICSPTTGASGAVVVAVDTTSPPPADARGATLVAFDGEPRFLTAGDFDGDGLIDLAAVVGAGSPQATVLRQCPAHDTRTCPLTP